MVALAVCLCLSAAPLAAQAPLTIDGRVVRIAAGDTIAVSGVQLTLHRVGRTVQGTIDSVQSGTEGGFQFRLRADSAAFYLVSARYAGIEYFGEPVRPPGASGMLVLVSDTSSAAEIRLGARHVIVRPPDPSGTRAVLDLLSIRNDGTETRIGQDSSSPSWVFVLPIGGQQYEVEEGDVSPTAVRFHGDTLWLMAPVAPGRKNLLLSYRLPVDIERPRWFAPTDSFDLLVEEVDATVRGAGLVATAPVTLMGSTLRRWSAAPTTGPAAEVAFVDGTKAGGRILVWLVGLLTLAVLAGGVVAYGLATRPPRP